VPGGARYSIRGGFWIWDAPVIFAPTKIGNNFIFTFQTEPGKSYTVEHTDTFVNPNWQSLPIITGDGTVKAVTNSIPGVAQEFYRLIEQ